MSTKQAEKEIDKDLEHAKLELPVLENPIYPVEFLNCMKSTAFHAMQEYLEKAGSPKEVIDLLEELYIFTSNQCEMENGAVKWFTNQSMTDSIASITRLVVAIGGTFYSPDGETVRREIMIKNVVAVEVKQ